MEKFNLNWDRPKISSEEIAQKQNFDNLLTKFKVSKAPVYKNPWFWGSAGLASVGLTTIISLNALSINTEKNDKIITQSKTELPKDTECIKPPVEGENVDYKTFKISPLKDETILLESGTKIEIKKGTLLANNLSQKVEIKVREFQDKSSVFIAGIPMDYQNNTAFESAGMIEIRGEQSGEEVKINSNKPLNVSLNITKNPETFDFWYLNESQKKWESFPCIKEALSSNLISNNSEKISQKIISEKAEIKHVEAKLLANDNLLSTLVKPKEEEYKIPKPNSNLFDLDFDKTDYPELANLKEVVFEIIPSKSFDPNFSKKNWSDIDLSKDGEKYMMKFKNSKESFSTQVRPVLKGAELKNAEKKFDFAFENFSRSKREIESKKVYLESEKKEHEKVLKKLIAQEKEVREKRNKQLPEEVDVIMNQEIQKVSAYPNFISFQAPQFGIYNCDKPISYPKPFELSVAFLWVGHQIAKFKQVFIFDLDKNTRYSYSSIQGQGFENVENIGFNKNNDHVVVGIDFDGNVGYAEFRNRKGDKSKQNNQFDKIVFTRKDKSISTLDLLMKLLDETVDAT